MATKGSVGRSLGQKHGTGTGAAGGDKAVTGESRLQQQGQDRSGGRGSASLGSKHPEATGSGNVGARSRASATGHAGQMSGRGSERVTEHHRK